MRALGLVVVVLFLIAVGAPAASAQPGRDFFDQITGPLREFVVFPDEFGVDVRNLRVDLPPLLASVEPTRARAHVAAIDVPRPNDSAGALAAARYISKRLRHDGYTIARQDVTLGSDTAPNVVGEARGTVCPRKIFVVGAHYDSVAGSPGADDNASGVAGMLEVAHALRKTRLPITVRYAGFAFEENGLVGSAQMAGQLAARRAQVVGMVSLEMIGFTEPDVDVFLGLPGTYLAMVGDPRSEYLARVFGAANYEYQANFIAGAAVIDPAVLGDILRSDHASFWDQEYRALLSTDTADFRNPNYHQPTDTIDTLDFSFLAGSARSTIAGLVAVATIDSNGNKRPDACEGSFAPPRRHMVGRGSVSDGGLTASYRYVLDCNRFSLRRPRLKIRLDGRRFRLSNIDSVDCFDDPAVTTPAAGFDTQFGTATGTLSGEGQVRVFWTLVDGGAGGADDSVDLFIERAEGDVLFFGSAAPPGGFPRPGGVAGENTALRR
jgi:hypothetical protein